MLPSVIDFDQTGFMPCRATDVNLRRLFTNTNTHHINEGTRTVASLDIEKAFNTVFLVGDIAQNGVPFDIYRVASGDLQVSHFLGESGGLTVRSLQALQRN